MKLMNRKSKGIALALLACAATATLATPNPTRACAAPTAFSWSNGTWYDANGNALATGPYNDNCLKG